MNMLNEKECLEKLKTLGQVYFQLESLTKRLHDKILQCDPHVSTIVESLKVIVGFLEHVSCPQHRFDSPVDRSMDTTFEKMIDEGILEERRCRAWDDEHHDDYKIAEAQIKNVEVTTDFSFLKKNEICKGCDYFCDCKSRVNLIKDELIKSTPELKVYNVITQCESKSTKENEEQEVRLSGWKE